MSRDGLISSPDAQVPNVPCYRGAKAGVRVERLWKRSGGLEMSRAARGGDRYRLIAVPRFDRPTQRPTEFVAALRGDHCLTDGLLAAVAFLPAEG
jgi:hypothetical protein